MWDPVECTQVWVGLRVISKCILSDIHKYVAFIFVYLYTNPVLQILYINITDIALHVGRERLTLCVCVCVWERERGREREISICIPHN
jgi:hypothetical protein